MPDLYFDDWDTLVSAVDDKLSLILKTDVSPVAEDILKKHIKADIYDAYTPKTNGWVTTNADGKFERSSYQRRHVFEDSVITEYEDSHTIVITTDSKRAYPSRPIIAAYAGVWSNYKRTNGSFMRLLESGNMGLWRGGFARPVIANTQAEIDSSQKIRSAIKQGIRREIGVCIEV